MDQAINFAIGNALNEQGAKATFYHNNQTFDPSTGKASGTPTSETVQAVIRSFPSSQIDGQVIRREDLAAKINANEFTKGAPKVDDEIEDKNGNRYKVISVKPNLVEHTPVSYVLQVRQ